MNWRQIAEDPICQRCYVDVQILESESSVIMQALSVLLTIQVAFAKEFLNTKVLQDNENITLNYEVSDGKFMFKLSAVASEETQLGLVFSDGVSISEHQDGFYLNCLFSRIFQETVLSPNLMVQL